MPAEWQNQNKAKHDMVDNRIDLLSHKDNGNHESSVSQTLVVVIFVLVTSAHALVGLLARVDPLAVDIDGVGECAGGGGVGLLADAADGLGEPVLEVDAALHAARVVAERAVEALVKLLRLLIRPRLRLGHPRLALPHCRAARRGGWWRPLADIGLRCRKDSRSRKRLKSFVTLREGPVLYGTPFIDGSRAR